MFVFISNLKIQVVYIFNFFLFLKLYVFVGCIKNNYIDVYLFDKDVLSFVKRSIVFFFCEYCNIICYEIFLIIMKIYFQNCDVKLKEEILKVFRDYDVKLRQQKKTNKIEFWCVNVYDFVKSEEIQWVLSVLYYRLLREDFKIR